ncbi:SatD family protein [Humidisolicoccus flavus]|uniref:SatD family protein n=1 Tax=Humidisolicoccus flavus TaxID=3111414 RepID=UPI00324B3A19
MTRHDVAVIVDIVRSRDASDRAAAQRAVHEAFDAAAETIPTVRPLWSTAGDEFQVVLPSVAAATLTTTLVQFLLPAGVRCRFGVGLGEIHYVESNAARVVQDGSAWWSARAAIEEAHHRESKAQPFLRTWLVAANEEFDSGMSAADVTMANAFFLLRDHMIAKMGERERRITGRAMQSVPQVEIAAHEQISQSAVSQSLRRSGGSALIAAQHALLESL